MMNKSIKKIIKPLFLLLLSIGFDPRALISLRHYPKYRSQKKKFLQSGGVITHQFPIFSDYDEKAGTARGHYFHQDLLVASFIHANNPQRHVDVGSRIDGFVAHVASFRKIEVMDVRDLNSTEHKNIVFIKANLMDDNSAPTNMADSISCLHAIEHFGLGRYGDPVDPRGYVKGYENILRMLRPEGKLFISFPIGAKNEVHFNAHRVFHPKDIFNWTEDQQRLKLERFDYVDDDGHLHNDINIETASINVVYGCGIYTFKKLM